ncbi:MAG: ferredoxin family protein [Actinobacteria bacterium]|nr:ferredoxin family protein [Actinomycetota bacterium]
MSVKHPEARKKRHIEITVDRAQCKACGICIALCSRNVYDRDGLGYPTVARPEACTACMLCDWHCPDFAIEVTRQTDADGGARGVKAAGGAVADDGSAAEDQETSAGERQSVTAAVTTSHKLSGTRRELPPDAEPRGSKED